MPNSNTGGPQIDPFSTIQDYVAEHGSEVFVHLNEFALNRESSLLGFYRVQFPRIPGWLQSKLPTPSPIDQISMHALELIERLGPVAARACAESVIEGINHPNPMARSVASRAFWYVLPGSERGLEKLLSEIKGGNAELFSGWNHRSILRWQWGRDFSQRLQMTNGLAHVSLGDDMFMILDEMGEDAVYAIPVVMDKMQLLDQPGDTNPMESADRKERFRRQAVDFLGKFATDRSNVSEFLLQYLDDPDPSVRSTAGRILVESAARSTNLVPAVLESLLEADLNAWVTKMRAIGHTGELGKQLLPDVERFTSEEYIKTWYGELEVPYKNTLSLTHLMNMKLAACVAVGRLAPEKVVDHLPFLVEAIGLHGDPVEFLKEATMLSESIVPLVEPYLHSPVDKKQIIAADILLHHIPGHRDALSTLDRQLASDSGRIYTKVMRLLLKHDKVRLMENKGLRRKMKDGDLSAAHVYSMVGQDVQYLLPLIEQRLRSDQAEEVNSALNVLLEMEEKPEQFIPLVQEALKSERVANRSNAFLLLLDYGVEHLPPLGQ